MFLFVNSFIFQPFVDHFRGHIRAEIEMKVSVSLDICHMKTLCSKTLQIFSGKQQLVSSTDLPCSERIDPKPGVPSAGHERYCSRVGHAHQLCLLQVAPKCIYDVNISNSSRMDTDNVHPFQFPLTSIKFSLLTFLSPTHLSWMLPV